MTIEIVIIVMLLASLFGAWVLSVWRKLEMQEENIRILRKWKKKLEFHGGRGYNDGLMMNWEEL